MNDQHKLELTPINHVVFVIDESGSMGCHATTVPDVFDAQVKTLAEQSVKLNQETRISLYAFNGLTGCRCIVYDRDVLRLPTLRGHYNPDSGTPLIKSINLAMTDLERTPEIHADHAFLLYVITDGQDTEHNSHYECLLRNRLRGLKDNWTVAALVPNDSGSRIMQHFGFHPGNVQIWDCTSKAGLEKAATDMSAATHSYMTMRSVGQKSTKNLFVPQQQGKRADILKNLKVITNPYTVFKLDTACTKEAIQPFVERASGQPYCVGSAYYELVKPETIQAQKQICLRTKPDGRLYSGSLEEVRKSLGLPTGAEIRVAPAELNDFQVFIQSTSVNRNVIPGQQVLVIKL